MVAGSAVVDVADASFEAPAITAANLSIATVVKHWSSDVIGCQQTPMAAHHQNCEVRQ